MARNVPLSDLIDELRVELGESLSRANGLNTIDGQRIMLRTAQRWLAETYDWPMLMIDRAEPLSPGARLYTLDEKFDPEGIAKAWTRHGSQWVPVAYGITPCEYNVFDEGVRSDPVLRWQMREDADSPDGPQYEVWPTPASAGTLRFYGRRKLRPLVDDSDVCDLDSTLIVYAAAFRNLSRLEGVDAAAVKDLFQTHLNRLRARQPKNKGNTIVMSEGAIPRTHLRPGLDYIPEGGA